MIDNNENLVDDVEFMPDEENSGGNSLSGESKLAKQKDKLDALKAEKEEYLLNWQKERAEFMNYKRDEESRLKRARDLGFEKGIGGAIKMLDTFDMAMTNQDAWNNVDANWRMGVEYIYQQGVQFLEDAGIQIINPKIGESVDPSIHDAVESTDTNNSELDHTVAKVVQKGYRTKDSVIRPAKVAVYKFL